VSLACNPPFALVTLGPCLFPTCAAVAVRERSNPLTVTAPPLLAVVGRESDSPAGSQSPSPKDWEDCCCPYHPHSYCKQVGRVASKGECYCFSHSRDRGGSMIVITMSVNSVRKKQGILKQSVKSCWGEAVKLLAIAVGISIPCLSLISVGRVSFKNRLYL
jgi:hypothetical protein